MKSPLKVLILEDVLSDAELIKFEIARSNIQFSDLIVDEENDYIRAICTFQPDIILSDYILPSFTGMEALSYRNKCAPQIPFILVTGSLNEETAVEIMKQGADDYVIKEHLTRIGTAIKGACEKHEIIKQKLKVVEDLISSKEKAETSEKRFHSLFENMIEGFAYCQMLYENNVPIDFIYLEVNHSFETLTGLKNVTGKKVSEVIPGIHNTDQELFEIYGRVARTGKPERFEMHVESLQDWYSVSVYSPETDHFIAVFDVITKRKKTERELIQAKEKAEESDRLKSAFLHNISHEIRTPLNAIVGFSSLLASESLSSEKRQEFQKIVEASNNQLLAIISDIISLSTLDAGQEKCVEKETNINELLASVYDQFMVNPINPMVEFRFNCTLKDQEAIIQTDPVKLMQIVVNLVGNALKFTSNGKVTFGYKLIENDLQFYVEDTGIGIPENEHEKIFERFRQVDNSATRKFGGTGLGLALSKGYVELLGGAINLHSVLNEGSVFTFTIPYKPVRSTMIPVSEQISILKGEQWMDKKILVVEDDYFNYMLLKSFLDPLMVSILYAENGEQAITLCENGNVPDLVLLDIRMPVMDGIQTISILKETYPQLPVIAVTAYANDKDRKRILANGFDDYLAKPVSKLALIAAIGKFLK
jgi:signal transduction histidine kinase/DNA-binding response OmpR family regulator